MINQQIQKITRSLLFSNLKKVLENNSYHNNEDAYSHSIKTKDHAVETIKAEFITDQNAKDRFLKFINEDFGQMKRADILILAALLHDIGKILWVKEKNQTHPLVVNHNDITICPGHEFWGSTIVKNILKDLSLSAEIITYIANIIKVHDTFNPEYFMQRAHFSWDLLINDVKSKAEGLYIEALFNIYCDCFDAAPFEETKIIITKIFNEPRIYEKREYLIP